MSAVDKRHSPVYRQLEAYGESWKKEHDNALACRDWEDAIAVGINIFEMLRGREQAWRDQVFRGAIAFAEEDNLDHQSRFAGWLATTREVLTENLPLLEKRFGKVEGAPDLRASVALADKILSEWQPPHLSRAIGFREMTLSQSDATELDRLVEEAKRCPPLPPRPKMQEMSASELKRRS